MWAYTYYTCIMCVHTYVCECFEDTLLSFQVYATCEFTVAPVHNPYHHTEEVVYMGFRYPGLLLNAEFEFTCLSG